jgi:hypothetical protein
MALEGRLVGTGLPVYVLRPPVSDARDHDLMRQLPQGSSTKPVSHTCFGQSEDSQQICWEMRTSPALIIIKSQAAVLPPSPRARCPQYGLALLPRRERASPARAHPGRGAEGTRRCGNLHSPLPLLAQPAYLVHHSENPETVWLFTPPRVCLHRSNERAWP